MGFLLTFLWFSRRDVINVPSCQIGRKWMCYAATFMILCVVIATTLILTLNSSAGGALGGGK